jgi:hypothetical protein
MAALRTGLAVQRSARAWSAAANIQCDLPAALMLAVLDDTGTLPVLQFNGFENTRSPPPFVQLTFAMIDQPLCLLGCPAMPETSVWAVCRTLLNGQAQAIGRWV